MMKVNIGLIGILIVIILITVSIFNFNSKVDKLNQELITVKSFLEDIDNDIHDMQEELKKK